MNVCGTTMPVPTTPRVQTHTARTHAHAHPAITFPLPHAQTWTNALENDSVRRGPRALIHRAVIIVNVQTVTNTHKMGNVQISTNVLRKKYFVLNILNLVQKH